MNLATTSLWVLLLSVLKLLSYQAFEAENPAVLKRPIQVVEQIENQPMRCVEKTPRIDFPNYFYMIALGFFLILFAAKTMEVGTWS